MLDCLKIKLRSFFIIPRLLPGTVCCALVFFSMISPLSAAICFLPDCGDKIVNNTDDGSAQKCKDEGYESYQNRVCHTYSIVDFCPYNSDYIKCNNKQWCILNDYTKTECEKPYELTDKCLNGELMYRECKINMEDACLEEDKTYTDTCPAGWVIDPNDHCSFSDEFGHCCNTCPGFISKEEIEAAGKTPVASCDSCDGKKYIAATDGYNSCEGYWDCQDGCAPDAKTCVSFGVTKCDKCKRCEAKCTYEECPYGMECTYEACTWRYCIIGCKVGYTYYCEIPIHDCALLGYDKTPDQCAGSPLVKCPYDEGKVYCMPDDGVCCEPCKDFPYQLKDIPEGYEAGEKCECCGKTLYKAVPAACDGYVDCPFGPAEGANPCKSGDETLYNECKDCPNACPGIEVCPKGTICRKDDCSGTYCPTGCETTYTNYCKQPITNCADLGYHFLGAECIGQVTVYCPYDSNWGECVPVDENDCCRNCKGDFPYTSIPAGYHETGRCDCCGKTYYQAEPNDCSGYLSCDFGGAEGARTCVSGEETYYSACKVCDNACILEACPPGTVCSEDPCTGLLCATGCAGGYKNYCHTPLTDCDALGYHSLGAECIGYQTLKCPYDTNMVFCKEADLK